MDPCWVELQHRRPWLLQSPDSVSCGDEHDEANGPANAVDGGHNKEWIYNTYQTKSEVGSDTGGIVVKGLFFLKCHKSSKAPFQHLVGITDALIPVVAIGVGS